ncbi:ATP-binding protein [Sagittula sp. SSi028]|uniref:ATP-binding protein n=1 Tax=Sagittula sp. SSi028 TaxID=3400636 RepID=UPI003AF91C05
MANTLEAVDPMVVLLTGVAQDHLSQMAQSRFGISLSEALTNLVLHAPTTDNEIPVRISLTVTDDEVVIEMFDPEGAPPFDLREHGQALSDVDVMAESGRGLGLIMECADRVDYGPTPNGNRLLLGFQKPQ